MKRTYKLTTPYGENLNKDAVWQDYPRPQFKRDSFICLNGEWDFAVSKSENLPSEYAEKILVPFPPESALSGIERSIQRGDVMYYRRKITLPEGFLKDRVIIHFGAVDQIAVLYVNGTKIYKNEGGYLPFCCDITDSLTKGENEIILAARDDYQTYIPTASKRKKEAVCGILPYRESGRRYGLKACQSCLFAQ